MQDDPLIQYNRDRWEHLARSRVLFSRPWLGLDEKAARERLDRGDLLGDVSGKRVLCLASGGGQQSAAFSLLGANVSVIDFCAEQLTRDRETADIYGFKIRGVEGDMRDLSAFADDEFDVVWQPASINYVREAAHVIKEAGRVLTTGGYYYLEFGNPYCIGMDERSWTGTSYPLRRLYIDGEAVEQDFDEWEIWDESGNLKMAKSPQQFRHTLTSILNALADSGFIVRRFMEHVGSPDAAPGTWDHFTAIAPSTLIAWSEYSG